VNNALATLTINERILWANNWPARMLVIVRGFKIINNKHMKLIKSDLIFKIHTDVLVMS